MKTAVPDYREFSISKLNERMFSHVKLLLFWPIFGILFLYFERIRVCDYHVIESSLDAYIPFVAAFIIPYFLWFVYLIGFLVYSFFTDVQAFKRCMWFIIITYSVTSIVYFVYPTSQQLRPVINDTGFFTSLVSGLYSFDTNTNVCPSIHVLGSMAVCFTVFKCRALQKKWLLTLNVVCAIFISFSTVFLKQHSIIDVFYGFVLSFAAYPLSIGNTKITRYLIGE